MKRSIRGIRSPVSQRIPPSVQEAPEAAAADGMCIVAQDALDVLVPHFRPRSFPAGTLLWREGDPANLLVLVDKGRIKAFRDLPSGRSVTLLMFGPGEILGFAPFFDGGGYPATAQALDDVDARVMERLDLLRALDSKQVVLTLFALFAGRLREAFHTIEQISHKGAIPRVAGALLALLAEPPTQQGFHFITLPTTAGVFAEALGLAPETFSRVVAHLVKTGTIHRIDARHYQVLDAGKLQQEAGASSGIQV
jgi:CRP-like cAMP-binding protein